MTTVMTASEAAAPAAVMAAAVSCLPAPLCARPRRSCLRRESTATTVVSKGDSTTDDVQGSELPSSPESSFRRVSFATKLQVKEYGMILGQAASLDGPPLTLDWEVQQVYQQRVLDHENPRKGVQLRMPASLRTEMAAVSHSQAEINRASFEARRLKSQRHMSVAMQEFEDAVIVWQSAVRKFQRWRRRREAAAAAAAAAAADSTTATGGRGGGASTEPSASAWLERNALKRGNRLVLKPGVAPHDPSTAFAWSDNDDDSTVDTDVSAVRERAPEPADAQSSDRLPAGPAEEVGTWLAKRKVSEDGSEGTAPSSASTEGSSTDEDTVVMLHLAEEAEVFV